MKKSVALAATAIGGLLFSSGMALACACCGTYQVTGVAPDDVLNMRAGPGVAYSTVGAIPAGSGCVAKTRTCRRSWCKVGFAGSTGWVNTRYLRYLK